MLKVDSVQLQASMFAAGFKPTDFGIEEQRPNIRSSFGYKLFEF